PEQPLAFVIVAPDESALAARLTRSGWLAADKMDTGNMLHLARKGLDYATAPLAPAFWNNEINPLAFERLDRGPQGNVLSTVRIWRTPFRLNQNHVFVGVAREYSGIRWGFMHTVLPDVDAAAERFAKSLEAVEPPLTACQQTLYTPMMGTLLMGGSFFTRGQIWLLDLGTESDIAQLCKKESALQ
nr:LssY C-terminal domain-containing protein [Brachymonas sp.]